MLKEFGQIDGGLEVDFFDEEGVCAECVGAIDVAQLVRGGEDDDGQVSKTVLFANPGENFEAGYAREFEVQEDENRERVFEPVGKFSYASEVGDGFFAGVDVSHRVQDGGFFEGALHQEDVVLQIFNDEY